MFLHLSIVVSKNIHLLNYTKALDFFVLIYIDVEVSSSMQA